jgi:hypothetical protein
MEVRLKNLNNKESSGNSSPEYSLWIIKNRHLNFKIFVADATLTSTQIQTVLVGPGRLRSQTIRVQISFLTLAGISGNTFS